MDNLKKLVNLVREKKAIFLILASLVVSITTYSLILPAFTLEIEKAKEQGGIEVEEQADAAKEESSLDGQTEAPEAAVKDDQPEADLTLEADNKEYGVLLTYDKDAAIPADASLAVDEIKSGKDFDKYMDKAKTAVDDLSGNKQQISSAKFFDITIKDGNKEIEPKGTVDVKFDFDKGMKLGSENGKRSKENVKIIHFIEDKKGNIRSEILDKDDFDVVISQNKLTEATICAESFSVYAIIYTVDFHYDMNGKSYDYTIEGGSVLLLSDLLSGLGAEIDIDTADIDKVTFSDPSLISITKKNNDFELKSLKPFDTEETLTVTLKNGDSFNIRVTDAQEIPDAEKVTIDASKSYLICYEVNGTYYLLKNDGTVQSGYHPDFEGDPDAEHDFEHLNSTFCWSFNHIFKENDVEHHLDKNYYLIRPIDNKSRTLALNNAGEALVQQGNNNVAVIQNGDGFILEGYHNVGTEDEHRYIHLGFNNGTFVGVDGDGVKVHIYEMNSLPTYDYTVRSQDETRGTVSVSGGEQKTETVDGKVLHYYKASSDHEKKNAGTITAVPVQHMNQGQNRWQFDHWEQDGLPLDRDQYGATISVGSLPIPYNGSNLVAYFRQNPSYVVPENEKEPSSIEDMSGWLTELQKRNIPLDTSATKKTAEVYDYQNRIYRVDLTSKANFETFAGNLDMAFCLDVSNSMYFPSKLDETKTSHYNGSNPTMPIYQINNGNSGWLDTSRDYDHPYYLIADASGTATVFKVYYVGSGDTGWYAIDASRKSFTDNNDNPYYFKIGYNFRTNWTADQYDNQNNKNHPFGAGDNDNTTYTIYDAGDNGLNRFHYLNESFGNGSGDLNTIANLLKVAGAESPGVNIAYNTFNKDLGNQRQDFQPARQLSVNLEYASGGGTRPDQAFNDAQSFSWSADYTVENGELKATDRYVILVTDGAPQGKRTGEADDINFIQVATEAATNLKNNSHVKLITIGLSMENVTSGKRFLYDIADNDQNGNKMFYMAESASDLPNIFRQITKVLMEDAVVLGDITDTVSDGFYLVDKASGLPLEPGEMIDIEGIKTTDANRAAGVVQPDGKTVIWTNQSIDSVAGWHGTVYVKAQEELLGGNGMNTNAGEATINATKYHIGGKDVPFDTTLVRDTLNLTAELPSPKVNVNELTFFNNETEWTVYNGTEVDPKQQLRAIYDSLVVEEVINKDGNLHYTMNPNSIEERWDDATGTFATFSLPGLIEKLIRKDSTLEARYFNGNELQWDVFLEDILTDGITLPYHEFGLNDGSTITITLDKTIAQGEEVDLVNHSPHNTSVTGDTVEKYVFRIAYDPDYAVTPIGQGGQSTQDFHTGTYGSMYQGHATGRESSTNTHLINVYEDTLDILKTDQSDSALSGAEFELYRKAETGEAGVTVAGLSGSYVKVASATSGTDGIASPVFVDGEHLLTGVTYYLLETKAPQGYKKDNTVWTVEVQTDKSGTYTDLEGETIQTKNYPFNWDQGSRIVVDGTPVKVITAGEGGTTSAVTDGSFVSDKQSVSFRYQIENIIDSISIEVNKEWNTEGDIPQNEITFDLYRVSEKGHTWEEGNIVASKCTETGVKEYTCSVCGKKDTHVIAATGHIEGTSHRENVVQPTCEQEGSFDQISRCKVCDAVISTEHNTIPATGHDWGEWYVTTPAQPGVPGVETRVCKNDPTHIETREIPALPVAHTVRIYFRCTGNGRGGVDYIGQITNITERQGTGIGDMTIQWDWNRWTQPQRFDVDGLNGSTYTTSLSNDGVEYQSNGCGQRQTLTIHNITQDLVIYILIRNNNYDGTNAGLIYQPTFSGIPNRSASPMSLQATLSNYRGQFMVKSVDDVSLYSEGTATRNANAEPSMTQSELEAYLNRLKTQEQASCEENNDHVYKEFVGSYTVKQSDNWKLDVDDLPKYNEYGNEYTYYLKETSVLDNYDTEYSGQSDSTGLHDQDSATIINTERPSTEISIVKVDSENTETKLTGAVFTLKRFDMNYQNVEETRNEWTSQEVSSEEGKEGTLKFSDLGVGYYELSEDVCPAGYVKTSGNIRFMIRYSEQGGNEVVFTNTDLVTYNSTTGTFTVGNESGAELPSAGGPGTHWIYLLGALMVLSSFIALVARYKTERQ